MLISANLPSYDLMPKMDVKVYVTKDNNNNKLVNKC